MDAMSRLVRTASKERILVEKEHLLGAPGYLAPLVGLTGPLAIYNDQMPLVIQKLEEDRFLAVMHKQLRETEKASIRKAKHTQKQELLVSINNFDTTRAAITDKPNKQKKARQSMANKHTIQQTCKMVLSKIRETCDEDGARNAFANFDEDGSGTLDKTEFLVGLRSLGINDISTDEFDVVWPLFDVSGDGEVDLDEFIAFLKKGNNKSEGYSLHRDYVYLKSVEMSSASRYGRKVEKAKKAKSNSAIA
jgi:hypothetical protein